ncbi:MAG: bifunctional sugar-1-phosphate nucleotidylyltransferase/acetyltransferase [Candidatus Heimdallarchaeaceae archaeon]
MKAVLFAAGEGLRLRPLTDTIPKPLLEILGETILERLIKSLVKFAVDEFIIITNYKEEQIKQKISELFPELKTIFIHQKEIKGTADALLLAKNNVKEEFFIAANGDCLYSSSIIEGITNAAKKEKIAAGGKLTKETEKYGIIIKDNNDSLRKIIEKPQKGEYERGFANVGIYSLHSKIFNIIEKMESKSELSSRGEYEITEAINRLLEKQEFSSNFVELTDKDYWFDIGYPWTLLEANQYLISSCEELILGTIEEDVYIKGKVVIKEKAVIKSGAYIEGPVFIDEGAVIGPNCYIRKYSYIGKKVKIGNGCEVKNSIIGKNTHAAHLSYIGDSIIGANCNFGAGTITANLRLDKKTIPVNIKDRKEDSSRRKLGAIIGDSVETGIGSLIMPGVKIGSNSWIGAGTIVNTDVPKESILFTAQEHTLRRKRKDAN